MTKSQVFPAPAEFERSGTLFTFKQENSNSDLLPENY